MRPSAASTYVNHTFTSHLALCASIQPFAGLEKDVICEYPLRAKVGGVGYVGDRISTPDANGHVNVPAAPVWASRTSAEGIRKYLVDAEISVKGKVLYRTPKTWGVFPPLAGRRRTKRRMRVDRLHGSSSLPSTAAWPQRVPPQQAGGGGPRKMADGRSAHPQGEDISAFDRRTATGGPPQAPARCGRPQPQMAAMISVFMSAPPKAM